VVCCACQAKNMDNPLFNLGVGDRGGGDTFCSKYIVNPLLNLGVGDGDAKMLGADVNGVEADDDRVGDGVDGVGDGVGRVGDGVGRVGDGVGRVGDGAGVPGGYHFLGRGHTTFVATTADVTCTGTAVTTGVADGAEGLLRI
jgi:hypothetical protein